ncbi:MAG TPA: autotransporter domain-containing protein [Spongiibacteraceae bacterium]|nr:autotransporter domain-containing protein [Spongiibacteraceae bacterium]
MLRTRLLAAAISTAIAAPTFASDYSNALFFGDSLTDAGTYKGQSAIAGIFPIAGKFTTNPGPVWAELVGTELGYATAPANQGGTDYAAGGARVDTQPGYPNNALVPFIQTAPSVSDQITTYLTATGGRADANALYSVWAGANDLFALQDGDAAYNALPMTQVADHLVAQINRLTSAGARYIVVMNLPDIGTTPDAITGGGAVQAQSTQYAQTFNHELFSQLAAQGIRVIPIDTYGLLHQIMSDAAQFGFTNITSAACSGVPSSLVCTGANYAAGTDQTYIFADGVHPTTAIHQILADYVVSVLAAPQQVAMLADSTLAARDALHDLLRGQLLGGADTRKTTGRNVWFSVQGQSLDRDNAQIDPGTDASNYQLALGMDFQINSEFVAGAALSLLSGSADYAQDRGNYSQRDITLSGYGSWQHDAWFTRGALAYGDTHYSLDRRVPLGTSSYTANGDTSGRDLSAQLEGGYEFTFERFVTGPVLGLLAQDLRIDSFDEKNAGVVDLGYGAQQRHSLIGSAGWQFEYRAPHFKPYARIAVDRDFEDNHHSVEVSALSIPEALPFSMPVDGPGRSRYTAQLGLNGELPGGAHFNIGVTQHFAQDNQRDLQVFGGIAVAF